MDAIYLVRKEAMRRGLSHKTIITYCFCINKFLKKTKKDLIKIKKADIQEYIDFLIEKGACGNTINVHLNALKFLFGEILCKRLLFRIKYSKIPREMPAVLTKDEVKGLINAINNCKHKLIVKLMYSAGLRVSELVNLRVKDLEIEKNYGWVRKGKGGKDRVFIISEKIKNDLIDYTKKENLNYEDWVFTGRKNYHIHQRSVQEIIKKAAKKANIKKNVHPHTLRHSFATHLIEDGYDLSSVQFLLGHNSAETTMIYVHMASPKMVSVKSPLDNLDL